MRLAPLAAALLLVLPGPARAQVVGVPIWHSEAVPAPAVASDDWLAYGRDGQLTNQSDQPAVTLATAAKLHERWRAELDGPIVASPLALDGVVYVSTEAGTVYAVRGADGAILWSTPLGTQTSYACGAWGISSTGAIDEQRALLYVANADGFVRALSLVTGGVVWALRISDRPDTEYVWGGLRLVGDALYVPVASYCDAPDALGHAAEGRIVSVDVASVMVSGSFDTVPGDYDLGGVWGWGGVSVEPDGSALWTAVGNSAALDRDCGCVVDDAGYGDSVLELTPSLDLVASARPSDVPTQGDDDFGAAPVLFDVPGCGAYAAANNKDGYLYIWRRDRLDAGPVAEFGLGTSNGPFIGEPSWSARENVLYDASTNVLDGEESRGDGVSAIAFTNACNVHVRWQTVTGEGTQPPPLILGGVVFATGGSSGWTALDARTGDVLWRATSDSPTLAPPIASDGRIFAGDLGGTLHAFGT
jgi:outer membrane protein assembly factor BamB